jgi:uncharacterized membrane protein YkvA (DUF1232 family)
MLERWQRWARALKRTTYALYLAARHPGTPWYARLLAMLVVGYALSPIDLIPDPIPVLGYLDDLVLLPLGIWLTLKLIPPAIWAECQARAQDPSREQLPRSRTAAVVIIALWLVATYLVMRTLLPLRRPRVRSIGGILRPDLRQEGLRGGD